MCVCLFIPQATRQTESKSLLEYIRWRQTFIQHYRAKQSISAKYPSNVHITTLYGQCGCWGQLNKYEMVKNVYTSTVHLHTYVYVKDED